MTYGQYIRKLRIAKNLSQPELASMLKRTRQYVSQVETGRQTFSPEVEADLIVALELSPGEIRTIGRLHNAFRAKQRRDKMKAHRQAVAQGLNR